jgi:hypothetical protein
MWQGIRSQSDRPAIKTMMEGFVDVFERQILPRMESFQSARSA